MPSKTGYRRKDKGRDESDKKARKKTNYWMTLRTGEERILSSEGGCSRSRYVEESFWRRLWACLQTEY
jgi:hypothetical protein